jgi:hypothetical protein
MGDLENGLYTLVYIPLSDHKNTNATVRLFGSFVSVENIICCLSNLHFLKLAVGLRPPIKTDGCLSGLTDGLTSAMIFIELVCRLLPVFHFDSERFDERFNQQTVYHHKTRITLYTDRQTDSTSTAASVRNRSFVRSFTTDI